MRRSRIDAERHIAGGDAFAAITYGRQAAMLIRHRFPAFYAAHVAELSTSPPHLLGVVQAFFSLAQQRLWLDHSSELTINPTDPLAVLRPNLSDGEALARLVNHRPILHTCRRQYCTIVGNRAQPPRSSAIVHTCRDRRQSCTACRPPV